MTSPKKMYFFIIYIILLSKKFISFQKISDVHNFRIEKEKVPMTNLFLEGRNENWVKMK